MVSLCVSLVASLDGGNCGLVINYHTDEVFREESACILQGLLWLPTMTIFSIMYYK